MIESGTAGYADYSGGDDEDDGSQYFRDLERFDAARRALPVPHVVRRALRSFRWFACRYCNGLFILGTQVQVSVHDEHRMCVRHEQGCARAKSRDEVSAP